ncbi:MAG: SH3 domain-containing protein [Desulfobacterales bacterium]|jgi:hypothetical protein
MESKSYKLIKEHISSFPDPIALKKGDKVFVGREYSENPDWPNWIECKTQNGKKGWIPKQYLKLQGNSAIALCDYSANELNVKIGDEISIHKCENGWAWSANSVGEFGWVPLNNIKI